MSVAIPPKIYELLKNVVSNDIDNYSILPHGSNKKGEGFLSDMNYVSLKDKTSGKALDFVVKQAFIDGTPRKEYPIRSYYLNEIYFYDKVWPAFQKLQERIPLDMRFDKVPRCFATVSEDLDEKLVLENLRYQNFTTHNKKKTVDSEHIEYIFKQYGRFHAISFAYKELNPQEYSEISSELKELWCEVYHQKGFRKFAKYLHELCLENLCFENLEEDIEVIEKYKHYVEDGAKIFFNSNIYKGNYSVILHGDCWSNNMMFKYDDSKKLIDMRLLDFQFSKVGTPVSDLSYCLYSGASKEILDELDYYLKVYHNSLLENVKAFGCNPENVYPFEELKKDWKVHCKMGFTMGLMVWRGKLTNDEDVKDLKDIQDVDEDTPIMEGKYDETTFKKLTRDLILHMYKNDFL